MRVKKDTWKRFVVAVLVTLSLAFLPMLSQQAIAGHHAYGDVSVDAFASSQEHASMKMASCAEKSDTSSTSKQMNCCDMSCSNFAAFETAQVTTVQLQISEHFEIDAEQLTSRISFGLMRPPRA